MRRKIAVLSTTILPSIFDYLHKSDYEFLACSMGNCILLFFVTILLCVAAVFDVRAGVLVGEADGGALPPPLRRRHRRTSGEHITRII